MEIISNGIVEGTHSNSHCLFFNCAVRAKVASCVWDSRPRDKFNAKCINLRQWFHAGVLMVVLWRELETLLVCLEWHVHIWYAHNNNVVNLNVLKTNEHSKLFWQLNKSFESSRWGADGAQFLRWLIRLYLQIKPCHCNTITASFKELQEGMTLHSLKATQSFYEYKFSNSTYIFYDCVHYMYIYPKRVLAKLVRNMLLQKIHVIQIYIRCKWKFNMTRYL